DNGWGISAHSEETRVMDAYDYAAGFRGMRRLRIDGSDFQASYDAMNRVISDVRMSRRPYLVQAKVPLLGHHTSGVRKEFYRSKEELQEQAADDPGPRLRARLLDLGVEEQQLHGVEQDAAEWVAGQFAEAIDAPDPDPRTVGDHVFVPTPVTRESG